MDFTLANLVGTKAAVVEAIHKNEKLPLHVRTFIAAEVLALPEGFNGARVDAHAVHLGGVANIHITVAPATVAA